MYDKVKDYAWDYCEFASASKHHLETHVSAVHSKIREYVCKECGSAFAENTSLTRHKKRVHLQIKDNIIPVKNVDLHSHWSTIWKCTF